MESELWESVEICLKEMLCANRYRQEHLKSDSLEQVQNEVNKAATSYAVLLKQLSETDRKQMEHHVDLLEQYSFEKEQRAYAQGLIDCFELLMTIGLIRENKFLGQIMKSMQKKDDNLTR